jgi:DNA-binding NarL/FixJ family response regulator
LTPGADRIRVALVEDDRSMREGLSALIGGTPGYACVAACASVEEAERSPALSSADVLLLDIHLPGRLGSEAVRDLKQRHPGLQVLMLTVYGSEDRIFESLCNGASGYLLKNRPPVELLDAIRDAHGGGSPMSPEVARKVVGLLRRNAPSAGSPAELNPREVRLLKLLSEGYSYQSAADTLGVSVNTVRTYVRSIYEKLQVHTRSEAVGKALRQRLIT